MCIRDSKGTVRTLDAEVRDTVKSRMETLVEHTAKAMDATASFEYHYGYPVSVNSEEQTDFAAGIAAKVSGPANVDANVAPVMGAEDFSYMLEARPGAFIFMGNGDTALLHHPDYDFNDEAIPHGCSYWVQLVEDAMPA